ncbi:hypothetical protein JWG40_10285 [Leptospira sp. 201903074]|uniref:hypothetical protein n=1 Tax=Leptospira abararensis TaxID=2810036 RepID=UPI0019629643|nr:hypothetical protein [Leptospira abararensis]MBM9547406.1 hypothetical protein [Leptospira abararensis]
MFKLKLFLISILEIYKTYRILINIVLFSIIGFYFGLSIIAQSFKWEIGKILKNDILNFFGSLFTVLGSLSAVSNFITTAATDKILRTILEQKICELISQSSISSDQKISNYINNEKYKASSIRILNSYYNQLFETRDEFRFDFQGSQRLLQEIKYSENIDPVEFLYLKLRFYSEYSWHWDDFVNTVKFEYTKNPNSVKESIWRFISFKENIPVDQKETKVMEYLHESIHSSESIFEKIIDAETTLSDKELFNHILSKTYINSEYNPINEIKKHKGPVLLIKNEEKYSSWWKKIDEIVKPKLLKQNKITAEEYTDFETRKDIEKKNKKILTQPFFSAIKKSPIINNFLEFLNQSPVFYFDTRDLPPEFSSNPNKYIQNKLKPIAKKTHSDLADFIKKEYKVKTLPKKELVMNYQLIPFSTEKMLIQVNAEDFPKPIQKLLISTMLSYDQKKKLVRSHIIETKRFIQEISPFSLASKAIEQVKIEDLRKSENVLLKELNLKKNGSINLRGLKNIIENEPNFDSIIIIIERKLKALKLPIKRNELKKVFMEILSNSKRIQDKISK